MHLQGTPSEIGFQHGYLLAPEIEDALKVTIFEQTRDNKKDWQFFRNAAQTMMWPHIEQEYRDELQGIADGAGAHGVKLDVWDVVALNAFPEWSYYVKQYDANNTAFKSPPLVTAPDHCSAFVATGSYTKDGKIVIAHNDWTGYMDGERWTIVFDIVPANGKRILMDGFPGLIHSGDDFGVNSAGIIITETTITGFSGYDPAGIPEFVRARKAMQYSTSIDDFARIMKDGNNGGSANDWLVADTKNNEIASLELGLKNVTLERKTDGYFVGSNFPINEKLAREETDFDMHDMSSSRQRPACPLGSADGRKCAARLTWRRRKAFWPTITTATTRKKQPERAYPLRPRRSFTARHAHVGAAIRHLQAWYRIKSHRRGHGGEDGIYRGRRNMPGGGNFHATE